MNKQLGISLLIGIAILYGCTDEAENPITIDQESQSILELITFDDIRQNGFSYHISGENLEKLAAFGGESFTVNGQDFSISPNFSTNSSANGRTEEGFTLLEGEPIIRANGFPNYGDIFVLAEAFEYAGGTCVESSRTCSGGTIVEVRGDSNWGPPSQFQQASIRINGANNNWLVPYSSVERYIGSSFTYQPGNYQSLAFRYEAKRRSCGSDDPMARARADWFQTSQQPNVYTIVKCDD